MYTENRIPLCSNMWPSSVVTSCILWQLWLVCQTTNIRPPSASALTFSLHFSAFSFSLEPSAPVFSFSLHFSDAAFSFILQIWHRGNPKWDWNYIKTGWHFACVNEGTSDWIAWHAVSQADVELQLKTRLTCWIHITSIFNFSWTFYLSMNSLWRK